MNALQALRANITFGYVDRAHRDGYMTDREFHRYVEAWTWSAARFHGRAGQRQDRYDQQPAALRRRINRMRRFLGFPEYPEVKP